MFRKSPRFVAAFAVLVVTSFPPLVLTTGVAEAATPRAGVATSGRLAAAVAAPLRLASGSGGCELSGGGDTATDSGPGTGSSWITGCDPFPTSGKITVLEHTWNTNAEYAFYKNGESFLVGIRQQSNDRFYVRDATSGDGWSGNASVVSHSLPFTIEWDFEANWLRVTDGAGRVDQQTINHYDVSTADRIQVMGRGSDDSAWSTIRFDEFDGVPFLDEGDPPDEDPCPSWMPDFVCGGVDLIGGIVGPIVDAIGDMASALLGAIGDMSEAIVGAIGALASAIWEQFQQLVLDPDEIGPILGEKVDELREGPVGQWADSVSDLLDALVPNVVHGSYDGLCVYDDPEVCLGPVLSDMPDEADEALSVLVYCWAAVTYVELIGSTVRSVRG